ncbi:MAG: hypothetical protein ACKOXB_10160 [Flavobacteriales bacterium]
MTYQEKYTELKDDFQKKSDKFYKLDKEISSVNGFLGGLPFEYFNAFSELQEAQKQYLYFLQHLPKNVNPNENVDFH